MTQSHQITKIKLEILDKKNETHIQTMYEIRTNPDVAYCLFEAPPKDYEQHVQYLTKIALDKIFFIISVDEVLCGYCQITKRDHEIELGLALHPKWWGKSIGSTAVELLIVHVKKEYPHSDQICLIVKKDNLAAIHIYQKHGFVIQSSNELNDSYLMHL